MLNHYLADVWYSLISLILLHLKVGNQLQVFGDLSLCLA